MPSNTADGYIYIDLQLRQDDFEKRLAQVEGKTTNFASKIKSTLLAIGIGAMAKQAATYIYNVGSEFEAAMSRVQAISGATGKELEALTEKAKELGASTKYSAPEVATAMEEMAKAGWSTQQILDGMAGVLDAAAASGEGLATTSTIVADAITGFGLAAKDSTRVADLLTQAANAGTIDIADLGETFKYIAPVAKTMGLSIEDVTTAVSAMSMAGIKGSQAGTSLRTVLARMVKPTDAVAVAMKQLDIVLTNQDGSFKSLDQIIAEMRKSFSGLTNDQKTYYATTLAGQEGMSGLLALLGLTQEEYNAIAKSMDNCNGVAKETAAIMQNNLSSAVEQMGGGLETIAISIYEKVAPALTEFVNFITNNVLPSINDFINGDFSKIDDFIPIVKSLTLAFVGLKAAMELNKAIKSFNEMKRGLLAWQMATRGTAVSTGLLNGQLSIGQGLWALLTGQMTLSEIATYAQAKAMGVLNAVMNANPIALVVAALAVLAAGFIYLWNTSEDFRKFWINLWNDTVSIIQSVAESVADFFTKMIPNAFNSFVTKLNEIGSIISLFFQNLWNGIISFFTSTVPQAFMSVCNQISQIFVNLWNSIVSFFTKTIPSWIENVKSWFAQLPYALGYMVGQMLGQLIQWGIDLVNFITVDIPNFINGIVSWFAQLPGLIWEQLAISWNNIVKWGSDTYISATQWISQTVNSIVNWFAQLPGQIWSWLSNAALKVISWGSDLAKKGNQAAKKLFDSVVNGIKGLPGKMLSIGSDIVRGIWKGISGAGGWLMDQIGNFADGIVDGIKDFFGIHSPSKVMADEIGKFLPKGIAVGFKAEMPEAENQMLSNTRKMVDNFKTEVNNTANRNQGNGPYNPDLGNPGSEPIDYTRLGNEMVNAFAKSGVTVNIDKRKAGRIIKEVQ